MKFCLNRCGNKAKSGDFCDPLCKYGFSVQAYRELHEDKKPKVLME